MAFWAFFPGAPSKIDKQAISYVTVNRCFKLFDSIVSNPAISCIIFFLPRTIVIITLEDNATLQIQSCVPSVFLAHFCHLCTGISSFYLYKSVPFHILSFVSIVFVNSYNSALVGCHMIWIKAIYLYLSIYLQSNFIIVSINDLLFTVGWVHFSWLAQ